ncbi:hypothetical protein CNMCM5623_000555 [Aspergillus felis]|uniref:Uncharacterized protein n=1 Tax=Aspergillus felis TaxID=1287682 RepID=A0A8H6Q6U1_9EURO|nr:hypothetical protein CNMCM5623_000555 [Aspergillus felis]
MRFECILAATLGALQLSQVVATPAPVTSDPVSLSARDTEARAPAVDTPAVQIDKPELLDLTEVESAPASHLAKRAILGRLKLTPDDNNRYRITVNGITVFLHIFYDLAREYTVFYWTSDQTPAPGAVSFGLEDPATGQSIPIRYWDNGSRWKWGGTKIYDIINVLV